MTTGIIKTFVLFDRFPANLFERFPEMHAYSVLTKTNNSTPEKKMIDEHQRDLSKFEFNDDLKNEEEMDEQKIFFSKSAVRNVANNESTLISQTKEVNYKVDLTKEERQVEDLTFKNKQVNSKCSLNSNIAEEDSMLKTQKLSADEISSTNLKSREELITKNEEVCSKTNLKSSHDGQKVFKNENVKAKNAFSNKTSQENTSNVLLESNFNNQEDEHELKVSRAIPQNVREKRKSSHLQINTEVVEAESVSDNSQDAFEVSRNSLHEEKEGYKKANASVSEVGTSQYFPEEDSFYIASQLGSDKTFVDHKGFLPVKRNLLHRFLDLVEGNIDNRNILKALKAAMFSLRDEVSDKKLISKINKILKETSRHHRKKGQNRYNGKLKRKNTMQLRQEGLLDAISNELQIDMLKFSSFAKNFSNAAEAIAQQNWDNFYEIKSKHKANFEEIVLAIGFASVDIIIKDHGKLEALNEYSKNVIEFYACYFKVEQSQIDLLNNCINFMYIIDEHIEKNRLVLVDFWANVLKNLKFYECFIWEHLDRIEEVWSDKDREYIGELIGKVLANSDKNVKMKELNDVKNTKLGRTVQTIMSKFI